MNESQSEKHIQDIRDHITELLQDVGRAEKRAINVSDEFIRLEVQIATILFTFSSLFIGALQDEGTLLMRLAFATGMIFLLLSFTSGLLHLKHREKFSDRMLIQRIRRQNKWQEVLEGTATYGEAKAFIEGSRMGDGVTVAEPDWTWILQSVCLAIGVVVLFGLALVFLFTA